MKNLFPIAICAIALAPFAQADLITNGSFETQADGETVASPPFSGIDSKTFTNWQFFNMDEDNAPQFTATIIDKASDGTHAMRLDATNQTSSWNYGINNYEAKFPVDPALSYTFSFDAAYISGDTDKNLGVQIAQFDAQNNLLSQATYFHSVTSDTYETFSVTWTPDPGTAHAYVIFAPLMGRVGTTSLSIDNIKLEAAP